MYIPAHFSDTDIVSMSDFIHDHPLGVLISHDSDGLSGEHLPFLIDRDEGEFGVLRAHVARASMAWKKWQAGDGEVMIVFQGASAYISPTLYPSKAETHRVVPTYNYSAVHAHGRVEVKDDVRWVRGLVARLTQRFEAGRPVPWRMGDAPAEFLDEQLKNIVGVEIVISRLEGKRKLSQNRTPSDRQGVIDGLRASGNASDRAVADAVEQAGKRLART